MKKSYLKPLMSCEQTEPEALMAASAIDVPDTGGASDLIDDEIDSALPAEVRQIIKFGVFD